MFGLKRPAAKSTHPLADANAAAQLIGELPVESPVRAVTEASAWLESMAGPPESVTECSPLPSEPAWFT